MKNFKLLTLIVLMASLTSQVSFAQSKNTARSTKKINAQEDIDTLGGNKDLMELAQSIKAKSKTRIVQERIINRNSRLEMGMLYGGVIGADSYVKTQTFGAALDFHINPRWSVGLRYYDFSNNLTAEGERIYQRAREAKAAGQTGQFTDIDYPLNATMAVVNWYPIYGKTSFMDIGVTQFDIYLLGGGGQINLDKGSSPIYTAGFGVAAWVNKHLSIRAEGRYQNYSDRPEGAGSRSLDSGVGSLGLGWIL
ncbi:hypothetical protein D3C87_300120 [compost metagenome]